MGGVDADLLPLVEDEHRNRLVRRRDVAVEELEREVRDAGVGEQLLRLVLVRLRVGAEPGDLLKVGVALRERSLRTHEPAHVLHDRDLLERRASGVAVDGEGQGLADPHVVKGLLLRVRDDVVHADPRRLLDREIVRQRPAEVVALLRGEAAELDHRLLAADGVHLGRRVGDDECLVAVEVGQLDSTLVLGEVVGVLLADPVLAFRVRDVGERPRPIDVLLVPVDIGLQLRRAVDEVPRRGEVRAERGRRVLQLELDLVLCRRADALDRGVRAGAGRQHPCRREDDLVVGRHDILARHHASVVELHVGPEGDVVRELVG